MVAVDGRHLDLAAQRRKDHGDRHSAVQIGALALEERMCADREENVEIPGRSAAHARLAFACEPYAGAILDARGDVDRERALARHPPGARAGWTGVVDDLSAALAGGTGPLEREETLSVTDASLAAAGRTSLGFGAGLGARARASLAGHRGGDADLRGLAEIGLLQADFHIVAQIGAALAAAPASTASAAHAEQVIEDVGEGGSHVAETVGRAGAGMLESGVAEAVVGRALVGILEDLVGLIDLLEADFAALVAGIAIGVPLHGELAEGGFQFALARRALDLEDLVVAALGHARVHPRHFRRSVVKSDPVTHDASKKMHPRGFGPRGLVAIENGMAKAASPRLGRLFVLLVVVDLGEFRVDDVLVLAAGTIAAGAPTAGSPRRGAFLGLLVHGLAELHRGLRQRIGLGRDRRGIAALERFLEVGHRVLDRAPIAFADLRAVLGERLLGGLRN